MADRRPTPRARRTARSSAPAPAPAPRRTAVEPLESRLLMATYEFGNTLPMYVSGSDFEVPTRASNYPTSVQVSGVNEPVTDVQLTIFDFYHQRPDDVDFLLVRFEAPQNSVMVMSDVGGSNGITPQNPISVSISDVATRSMPDEAPLATGTYRPTDYEPGDPVPETPFNAPSHTRLIDLVGNDPNGYWLLYMVDDEFGGEGGVVGGWTLKLTTGGGTGPAAPSTPDLVNSSDSGISTTDNITRISTATFSGTAPEGTQVRLYIDNAAVATVPVNATTRAWNATVAVEEGQHVITARALNAEGNEGASSGDLLATFDYTAPPWPDAPDMAPESDPDGDNVTSDTTPTFRGTVTDAARVQLSAQPVAGGTAIALGAVNPDALGNYTVTPATALAPGRYYITAASQDAAGNVTSPSLPLEITVEQQTTQPPQVTAVYLNGRGWTDAFRAELVEEGKGDAALGFLVQPGAEQLNELPWSGIDIISIRFSQDVSVQLDDLQVLSGLPGVTYALSAPSGGTTVYNQATRTATWVLDKPLANYPTRRPTADRVRLVLDGDAPNGVRAAGAVGAYLDGEWTDGNDSFPSGNGTGGGDMRMLINVVPGDVNQNGATSAQDYSIERAAFGRSSTAEGTDPARAYTYLKDVNANGSITTQDLGVIRGNLGGNIGSVTAPASTAGTGEGFTSADPSTTDEIFSTRPILA